MLRASVQAPRYKRSCAPSASSYTAVHSEEGWELLNLRSGPLNPNADLVGAGLGQNYDITILRVRRFKEPAYLSAAAKDGFRTVDVGHHRLGATPVKIYLARCDVACQSARNLDPL